MNTILMKHLTVLGYIIMVCINYKTDYVVLYPEHKKI